MNIEKETGGAPRRAPSQASMERAAEHKEMLLKPLEEAYRAVQMEIVGLEKDLQKGIEHTIQNPEMKALGIEVGRGINRQLTEAREKMAELEEKIRKAGGNPSDYTVQ